MPLIMQTLSSVTVTRPQVLVAHFAITLVWARTAWGIYKKENGIWLFFFHLFTILIFVLVMRTWTGLFSLVLQALSHPQSCFHTISVVNGQGTWRTGSSNFRTTCKFHQLSFPQHIMSFLSSTFITTALNAKHGTQWTFCLGWVGLMVRILSVGGLTLTHSAWAHGRWVPVHVQIPLTIMPLLGIGERLSISVSTSSWSSVTSTNVCIIR